MPEPEFESTAESEVYERNTPIVAIALQAIACLAFVGAAVLVLIAGYSLSLLVPGTPGSDTQQAGAIINVV